MNKPIIELINNNDDWEVLQVNFGEDFKYEGHSIPNHIWVELLNILGYEVEKKTISQEDMENEKY